MGKVIDSVHTVRNRGHAPSKCSVIGSVVGFVVDTTGPSVATSTIDAVLTGRRLQTIVDSGSTTWPTSANGDHNFRRVLR